MLPPQKPWENAAVNQRSLPSVPNSDGLQSSAANVGSYAGTSQLRPSRRNPPPLPPRLPTRQNYQNGYGVGIGNYYNSPFNSYGGFGSGYSNYSNYGYSGYGNYNNYGNYGGFGYNRMGFSQTMPESRFIQMAEDGTRPAFQSIESLVHAFGSVSFMLESTFNAMYSSFRAVLGVAENFGRLRALFGQFLSVFAVFRWLRWLYRKCLFVLGLRREDPGREQLWQQASQGVAGEHVESGRQRTWPIMVFLGIILSGPYLMWKLLSSIDIPNIDPYNTKDWCKCKGNGNTAIALYDFAATSPQELSLRAGQKVIIGPSDCQQSQSWLVASVDGKRVGVVPANYIKIVGSVAFKMQRDAEPHSDAAPIIDIPAVVPDSVAEGPPVAERQIPDPRNETAEQSNSTE